MSGESPGQAGPAPTAASDPESRKGTCSHLARNKPGCQQGHRLSYAHQRTVVMRDLNAEEWKPLRGQERHRHCHFTVCRAREEGGPSQKRIREITYNCKETLKAAHCISLGNWEPHTQGETALPGKPRGLLPRKTGAEREGAPL